MNHQYKLHAIIDPLCVWCYAAAPLLDEAKKHFSVVVHGGGLWGGDRRKVVSAEFRKLVLSHMEHVQNESGQTFAAAFTDDILHNDGLILDSIPPTAAILALQSLGVEAVKVLHDMQIAYYQQGKYLSEMTNLVSVAALQGVKQSKFEQAFEVAKSQVEAHITDSRKLLVQVGSKTFPTFALETAPNTFMQLDHQPYYGRTGEWREYLQLLR